MKTCEEVYQDIQPLMDSERHDEAVSALEKLLETYHDFAQGHNDLGILYHKVGNGEKALNHLRESVKHEPEKTAFLKNLADFYYSEMGDVKGALKYYHKVLDIIPDDIDALIISGHIAVSEHRFDDAKGFYKKVLDIEPWNDDAWKYLERLDEYTGFSRDELRIEEMYRKCKDLVISGDEDSAIKEIENFLKIEPDFAIAYNDLGVLNYNLGKKEKALEYYEKATRLEPNNTIFQKNLADFYYIEMGRVEDALEIYSKVLSEEPADVDSLMAAGQISEAFNKEDNAKIFYDRVLDIEPWNIEASESLEKICNSGKEINAFLSQDVISAPQKAVPDDTFEPMDIKQDGV